MSILGANLKLYIPFQKQPLMVQVCLVLELLFITVFLVVTLSQNLMANLFQCNQFSFYWLLITFMFIFIIGQMIAMIQLDVLSKPFSFCLPSHHKVPQRIFLISAIITIIVFSFATIIMFRSSTLKYSMLIMVPFFVVTAYSLATCFTFNFLYGTFSNLVFKFLLIPFFIMIFFKMNLMISFNDLIIYSSIPLIIAAILLLTAVLNTLGDPNLNRKCFERNLNLIIDPNADLLDQLQTIKTRHSQRMSDTTENDNNAADTFLRTMNKHQFFSMYHSLMGRLYYTFSRYYVLNMREAVIKIFFAAFILFISGYLGSNNTKAYYDISISPFPIVALIPICMMVSGFFTSSNQKMLLPLGRTRQFLISVLLCIIKYTAVAFFVSMVIAISWTVQDYMPNLTFNSYKLVYNHPGTYTILWTLIIMPVMDLIFDRVEVPYHLITMILLTSTLFIFSFVAFVSNNITVNSVFIIFMSLITNGLFISLLTRHWLRRDHV
jgi:hypothetical protein